MAKAASWQKYVSGISSDTPIGRVWGKVKKLSGKFVPSPTPALTINNQLVTDHGEVSTALAAYFAQVSHPSKYTPDFQAIRATHTLPFANLDFEDDYNIPFSIRELEDALSKCKSTSPGDDGIHYEMLSFLPLLSKIFLLDFFNLVLTSGTLPSSWKMAVVVPILKPGKPHDSPSSYRPIALTSCVCKTIERMVNARLCWHLETHGLLSEVQSGFRRDRSTLDPLLRLSTAVQESFLMKGHTLGVFFDIEKAYDMTWRGGILESFRNMGVRGYVFNFLSSFLTDRNFRVRVGTTMSPSFEQVEGVPQGSVLSVTCFLVAINGIISNVATPVRCSLYADDLAVYCSGCSLPDVHTRLQRAVNTIVDWADGHGFKFSTAKSVAMHFTRSRSREVPPHIIVNESPIVYEQSVKFLGMLLDPRLDWSLHLSNLRQKVLRSFDLLRVVSGHSWGADQATLLRLYSALCRSKLDYGSQIYGSATKTALKMLDPVHHRGLRICTGASYTSPVDCLYSISGFSPLDLRRDELSLRYLFRLKSCSGNPASIVAQDTRQLQRYNAQPSVPKPMHIRLTNVIDPGFMATSVQKSKVSSVAPWVIPPVCHCPFTSKMNVPGDAIRAEFLDHQQIHTGAVHFYTDGSKSRLGVGCAVISSNSTEEARLSDFSSVFTSELSAIIHALIMIFNNIRLNFVIFSDSQSAIVALKQFFPRHPLVVQAQLWLHRIHTRYKTVKFCWVPAHVGVGGNELADAAAKRASISRDRNVHSPPYLDLRAPIRDIFMTKWQSRFDAIPSTKLRAVKPYVKPALPLYKKGIIFNRVVTRLRIGHSKVTHDYLLNGIPPPLCIDCGVTLTVLHILIDCDVFHDIRRRKGFLNKSLYDILGEALDPEKLFDFLRGTGLYFDI